MTPRLATALLVLTLACASPAAHADTKSDCIAAFEGGGELRASGKLLEARQRLYGCAASTCSGDVQRECAKELAEVDAALPSIVLRPHDARGQDLVRARATIDGVEKSVDGLAVPLDPGPHVVRFEMQGCAPSEQTVLSTQGEKNRTVEATLQCTEAPSPSEAPPAPSPSLVLPAVLGGIGVVGLAGLTYFGLKGKGRIEDIRATGCAPACDASEVHAARTKLVVADVLGAVGLVSLGAAVYLVLSRPSPRPAARTSLDVTATSSSGALLVRGAF